MSKFNIRQRAMKAKLKNINIMKFLDNSIAVKILCPPKDSTSYKNIKEKLKRLDINKTPERIASYKVIMMMVTFCILILINLSYINSENKKIIYGEQASGFSVISNNSTENNQERVYQTIIQQTIKICPNYMRLLKQGQYQQVVNYIRIAEKNIYIDDENGNITKTVFNYFLEIANNKINISNILFYVLLSFISTSLINLYLYVLNNMKESAIYKEFKTLELLTIVLIKNTDISTEKLLSKLHERSDILKPYFRDCLISYPPKKDEAIKEMMREVNNENFSEFMTLVLECKKGDKEVNNKLLEANKNLGYELDEEDYMIRLSGVSIVFTIMSFPIWALAILLLFIPILINIKWNL